MAIFGAVGTKRMILSTLVCGSNMDLCKETKKTNSSFPILLGLRPGVSKMILVVFYTSGL